MFTLLRTTAIPDSILVNVSPFYYIKDGSYVTFGSGEYNLTTHIPTTPNYSRLVLLGLNTTTNILTAYEGPEGFDSAMTPPTLPTGIGTDFIPSALIRLKYGAVEVSELDITDARTFLSSVSGGTGGWPFDNELTIDQTNTNAAYSTILAALTAAAAGNVLTLGPASYSEAAVTINKNISIQGESQQRTLILNPFTVDNSGADISNLYVYVSGTGTFGLKFKSASGSRNITAEHRSVTNARAVVVEGSLTLRDVYARSNGSTTSYAMEVAATGSVLLEFDCYLTSSGAGTNYDLYVQTGGFATLNGCILANGTIGGDFSNVTGWYRDANGKVYFLPEGGHNTGVWLLDASTGMKLFQNSFEDAMAVVAGDDVIKLDTGEFNYTGSFNLTTNLTIEGEGPEDTTLTLTVSDDAAFDVQTNGVELVLRNLTLLVGGSTGSVGAFFTDNASVKITLDNAIVKKDVGTSTTGYGAWMEAGTLLLRNGAKLLAEAGTSQYGIYNVSTATTIVIEEGCEVGGGTKDVYGAVAGSTLMLAGCVLTNAVLDWAGTKRGHYKTTTGLMVYLSVQKGTLSVYPNIGSTTTSEMMGHIYQAKSRDIYSHADEAGLAVRTIYGMEGGISQAEDDFDGSSLDAGWSWAGSPFVTPTTNFSNPSILMITFGTVNNRAFMYRTNNLSANHKIRVCLTAATNGFYIGHRWDDGTDNNYVEAALRLVTLTSWDIIIKKRAGGGAVTTTSQFTITQPNWVSIMARPFGTLYSNWNSDCLALIDAPGAFICQNGYMAGATWTPTRRGLIFNSPAGAQTWEAGFIDWAT